MAWDFDLSLGELKGDFARFCTRRSVRASGRETRHRTRRLLSDFVWELTMTMRPGDDLALLAESAAYDRLPGWRREPPEWDVIDRPDLLAWSGPLPNRDTNRVAYARWSEADAQQGIDEVLAFFRDRHVQAFEWDIGPSSRPRDLASRLIAGGLVPLTRARLLTMDLGQRPTARDTIVEIRAVVDEETARHYLSVARPEWSGDRVAAAIQERIDYTTQTGGAAGYLVAFMDDEAVGVASWRDSSDGRAVYLTGASTRPTHRRRGVYTALVCHRSEAAARRGRRVAAITAIADTSAPILRRLGFSDHGELVSYGPKPSNTSTPAGGV